MAKQKGRIKTWKADRGFGFIKPEDGSRDLFVHISNAKAIPEAQLKAGVEVEYEVEQGRRGPQATKVRLTDQAKKESAEPYRFLNPYNFVRYLPIRAERADNSPEVRLMGRCSPPPHDRWAGLSGEIECHAEAVTPIFVSDSEGVTEEKNKHHVYSFFNVQGEKMIPASSLRGAVRSLFEAVTNSCFATFSDTRLSYRLDTRDARRLVPACIEKVEKGEQVFWQLRLLTGSAQLDANRPPRELYAAPVRQYKAHKPTGRRRTPPPPVNLELLGPADKWHGQECWAVMVDVKFPPSWRVVEVAPDEVTARKIMQQFKQESKFRSPLTVKKGWLCLTNQNTDNKNSERFFFTQGRPQIIPLPDQVRENYQDLIKDYQERHERTITQWGQNHRGNDPSKPAYNKNTQNRDMAFSRFILNKEEQTVKGGELVYALLRGRGTNLQVLFMAPVSVPRVAYNHTIGDLLSPPLHHCDAEDALCPACRTFGWVRGEEDEEGAYASRVRFTHANLLPETSKPQAPMRLAILGSPKPTTTRFYLVGPNGQPSDRPRSNDTVGYDGNHGNNLLRGRKMYRHHQPNEDQLHVDTMSDQNRTIKDAEGAGAVFSFTVKFENLAPVELGALLWALEVGGKGYHRLGYGKPLGLGSLKVSTAKVRLQDVAARYTSLDHTGWCEPLSETEQQTLVEHFQNAMITRYPSRARQRNRLEAFDALPNVQDILALVSRAEPSLPVHYPFSPDPNSKGQFEWFVGNNRQKGPKVELPLATEDQGLPLIDKRGNVHDHLKE